jgi:hypothetical protein
MKCMFDNKLIIRKLLFYPPENIQINISLDFHYIRNIYKKAGTISVRAKTNLFALIVCCT